MSEHAANGSIVIDPDALGVLRTRGSALPAAAVLWCAGGFCDGDTVYVVVRAKDGGQRAAGTVIAHFDAAAIAHDAADRNAGTALLGDEFVPLPRPLP